jgi:hypothetical protein
MFLENIFSISTILDGRIDCPKNFPNVYYFILAHGIHTLNPSDCNHCHLPRNVNHNKSFKSELTHDLHLHCNNHKHIYIYIYIYPIDLSKNSLNLNCLKLESNEE